MDLAQRLTSGESILDARLHRDILSSCVALIGSRSPIYCKKLGGGGLTPHRVKRREVKQRGDAPV
jgi:hypothetical protein